MKQLFGNKKSSNIGGSSSDRSDTCPDLPPQPQPVPPAYHRNNTKSNNSKTQPLIETLRSADTVSVTPSSSTTSTSNFSHATPTLAIPETTNQQQMNKKLFRGAGNTTNYSTNNRTTAGSTATGTGRSNRKDLTAISQPQQPLPQHQSDQSQPIGYTTSNDPTDTLTTTTSFSTVNVSLMVPPSQQRRRQNYNSKTIASRKLPPETIVSTSQQQYRPPSHVPVITSTTAAGTGSQEDEYNTAAFLSNAKSSALTYPRRSVYSTEQNLNHDTEDYGGHHDAINDGVVHHHNDHDGIDQEHYNRLLCTTPNNPNDNNTNTTYNNCSGSRSIGPSKSRDTDDDDIVPFAASCLTRPSLNKHNDASMTTVRFQNNTSDEIATKIPNKNVCYAKFQYYFVRTGLIYILIVVFTAVSMLYGLSDQLSYMNRHRHRSKEITNIQVAFIGNAYFFVNDIPRLLESISQGFIYQNSCLHAGGSLSDLWVTGNGMYKLWQTNEAMIEYATSTTTTNKDDDAVTDDGDDVTDETTSMATTYDYGFCSVLQLLQGYDKYMTYGNTYGKYYSDGLNPCIVDYNYDNFIQQQLLDDPISSSSSNNNNNYWDYIIIVEQTKRMAFKEARNETVNFLMNRYGPLIRSSGAIPVLVDTHAFWSSKSNMTGLTDIPTFAALIAQGVTDFSMALSSVLPAYQAPLVAPIGLAYLTIWEEDYSFWQKLFLDDGIHASLYGSYLFACVLFATLFDQLPTHNNNNDGSSEYDNIALLFTDARKIVGQASYPSVEEAEYLRNVAGRVTLRGHVPPSLLEALSTLQQNDQYAKSYSNR